MIKICQGLTTLFLLIFCTFNILCAQNPESTAAVRPLFTGPAPLHITGYSGIVHPLISFDRDGTHRISTQSGRIKIASILSHCHSLSGLETIGWHRLAQHFNLELVFE
jgi:succinate dehydrogenase/fumarate reductase cytochrome b subunit